MAEWRKFNASGANRTCLWCGRPLRKHMRMVYTDATKRTYRMEHTGNYGDYGDNSFCGLRCGYRFGARLAELGHQLVRQLVD